jgi:hypothetical protein
MKDSLLMNILTATVIVGAGCEQQKSAHKEKLSSQRPAVTESVTPGEVVRDYKPPLLLEDEPLLLLDDAPDADTSSQSMADNSRCFVCHINYMQEDIAVTHARAGMGCANCHGESDEHIADESWASGGNGTAPGRMFIRAQINPFCMECHTREKIDIEEHKSLFAQSKEQKYCTDCHGDHRLTERKCKWK